MKKRSSNSSKSKMVQEKSPSSAIQDVAMDTSEQLPSVDERVSYNENSVLSEKILITLRQKLLVHPSDAAKVAAEKSSLLSGLLDGLILNEDSLCLTVILSKLIWSYPCARRFAEEYYSIHGSPLRNTELRQGLSFNSEEPRVKKRRKSDKLSPMSSWTIRKSSECFSGTSFEVEEIFKALLIVMRQLPYNAFCSWDSREVLKLNSLEFSSRTRWFALHCLSLLLRISETETEHLMKTWNIHSEDRSKFSFELQCEIECRKDQFTINFEGTGTDDHGTEATIKLQHISQLDETSRLISIDGLIIKQKLEKSAQEDKKSDDTVLFPSFINRLKDTILHVTNNSAVCIIGSIGSGKSTIMRKVSSLFGREEYPDFISVQMNDQIDSRIILGSYHSTDLPGQFVWKPGCLTKAVLNGHWIVFEDLDTAPMDVITLLDGFLDTRSLSVPGFGEIDTIHPEFRIFATCRNQFANQGGIHNKIGKLWKKIYLKTYSFEEIKLIVESRFVHLRPIVDVLVTIYMSLLSLLKDGRGDRNNARSLSIRDFLKFCQRIPKGTDFTSASSSITILQEGLDLFVSAMTSPGVKESTAEVIGTHLNLLKAKSEYFLTMHTPNVGICAMTNAFVCGRFSIPICKLNVAGFRRDESDVYSLTRRTCNVLESICGFVKNKEHVLLVGETGVGKTSSVQHLAKVLNQKLIVVNLNRQSDSVDLLGGYKPVELKYVFLPLREEFETLFGDLFNKESNSKYLTHLMTCYANKRWNDLTKLMRHVEKSALTRCQKVGRDDLLQRWSDLFRKLTRVENQMTQGEESPFAFSFIDGTLIKAIKYGHWILLDEINLATSEMLQCLAGVLDENAQIHLWEKGDEKPIQRHPDFHLFAAMNPSTDVGKKDLPVGIRNRFSELYVGELNDADELRVLVSDYLKELCLSSGQINNLVQFYLKIRTLAQSTLVDGLGKKPHYSLRTFCRALKIASMNLFGSVLRSLYESFCLSFLTQLDFVSHPVVEQLVAEHIFGKTDAKSIVNQPLPCPKNTYCVQIEGYWIPRGELDINVPDKYILTSSIRRNLKDIVRIVSAGKLPVLIQGATSVGKTSLIQFLAECSGNRCYRINNHQHTDLQEYVGSYQSDKNGKLVFAEGVLVQAMRKGEWIILDELNLAPSEVLEALNRLLDDNRQLFITETGLTVTAHPRFMLFATQNPPGLYGGRKILSRAFRNRFVELHFDEIPSLELENILHLRCAIPVSYCKKIIGVMKDLQVRRKASAALQGKHGFATLRDLFRWAERYRLSGEQKTKFYDWDQHLADEGYLVLAGKERKTSDSDVIREVLEKKFKRKVDPNNLFSLHDKTSSVTREILELVLNAKLQEFQHIVWTSQMRRLAVLIGNSMKFKEPTLLVGDTGCGKTTIVQLLSQLLSSELYCVNCHMNSEGSDFLGGLRPVRDHSEQNGRLFEWVDGPLVEAMERGGIFLADEISLADDSVLERLNSVLEPERTLLIAEKGEEVPRLVVADTKFHFVGTMNPGGDYGKKELSPALRNRLTEIWCDSTSEESDLISIVEHNLVPDVKNMNVGVVLINFVKWLQNSDLGQKCVISIRDYLSWTNFINHMIHSTTSQKSMFLPDAIIHGACMAFLDGLGTGSTGSESTTLANKVRSEALNYLRRIISDFTKDNQQSSNDNQLLTDEFNLSIGPFAIPINPFNRTNTATGFAIEAPTTSINGMRLLRAMQLAKPILLEGSPGVGKTALVSAIAKVTGYSLTRINLSEQTDISDLFGADLPVEGKEGGYFEWRDGPLLQALKSQSWILLDELNLASQSVLEGLNACLDHRGSIYIPELNKTFQISTSENVSVRSRIFACQNPVRQGGARKGLPKSFLNRFIQVYVDSLSVEDFEFVLQKSAPLLPKSTIHLMSIFASRLHEQVCQHGLFAARGSPWDINLRDLMRWVQLTVQGNHQTELSPEMYVDLVYGLRMRCLKDRQQVLQLFCDTHNELFPDRFIAPNTLFWGQSELVLSDGNVFCGQASLPRVGCVEWNAEQLLVLRKDLAQVEAIITCLGEGWMPILVGPSCSGKTSLVKLIAQLCGRKLEVMHPSPEMDTIELLGGFEQADIYRRVYDVRRQLDGILLRLLKDFVLSQGSREDGVNLNKCELFDLWAELKNLPNLSPEGLGQDEEVLRIQSRVDFLQTAYLKCKSFSKSESGNPLMLPYENKGDSGVEPRIQIQRAKDKEHEHLLRVSKELEQIYTHLKAGIQTGAFQWIDSRLIKAVEKGEWLLVDGANRCSAAVLDRLNSLMEPNGSILLSERGSIDGNILEIKPHPEFRLILTVDPIYGEISRAMRNRGVEIYMSSDLSEADGMEISVTNDSEDTTLGKVLGLTKTEGRTATTSEVGTISLPHFAFGINFFDLDNLLRAEGLRDPALRRAVINLYLQIRDTVASPNDYIEDPLFKVISSTKEIVLQLQQGISFPEACKRSVCNVYMSTNCDTGLSSRIEELVTSLMKKYKESAVEGKPLLPLAVQNFMDSDLYRVWKHLETFECICYSDTGQQSFIVDHQYIQKLRKELLEDFLILSVFSRVIKHDATALSIALGRRYPLKASFLSKLATVLDSQEYQTFTDVDWQWRQRFWDIQEVPCVIVKFCLSTETEKTRHLLKTLKTSLNLYYQTGIFHQNQNAVENPKKGSLGFVLKNLKYSDAGSLYEFLQAFWALVTQFQPVYESCLTQSTETSIHDVEHEYSGQNNFQDFQDYAKLWLDGMKIALWDKRLQDLCSQSCTSSLPNEKLMAQLNLILPWVEEQVVPVLYDLGGKSSQQKMKNLVESCFKTLNHCRDRVLLQRNKGFRDMCPFRFLSSDDNEMEMMDELMQILFLGWDYEDCITKENMQKFFISDCSKNIHTKLCDISRSVLQSGQLTSDDKKSLVEIREYLQNLKTLSNSDENTLDDSSLNLLALQEYLRLTKRIINPGSTFMNPFLLTCEQENIEAEGRSIMRFLKWEDQERFRNLFVQFQVGSIQNSHLLPIFASRILIDRTKVGYKVPSLESNGVVGNSQKELNSLLTAEMTNSPECYRTPSSFLNLFNDFTKVLNGWRSVFSNEDGTTCVPMFQEWGYRLEEARLGMELEDFGGRCLSMAKTGAVMVEAASCMMEVSSYLPAVDPVVEKEVLAKYLDDQINVFETWIHSKRMHQLVLSGQDIVNEDLKSSRLHPFTRTIVESIVSDRQRHDEAVSGIIPRPDPPMYTTILQDLQQFVGTFGSLAKVKELTDSALRLFHRSTDFQNINSVLIQCENWLDCHKNFVSKIYKRYWYWDISAAFLDASVQASVGFQLICDGIRRHFMAPRSLPAIVRFPRPYQEQSISIASIYEDKWAYQKAKKRVFMTAVISFGNKLKVQQRISTEDVIQLQTYCTEFSKWWDAQEQDKRRKQDEEDAFYLFKGKERAMEKTDEEQENFDIKSHFPSFEAEFKDLENVTELEDGFHTYKSNEEDKLFCDELTTEDVEAFMEVHNYAASLVANRWLSNSTSRTTEIDFVKPFMNMFEVGCFGFADGSFVSSFDYDVEREFIIAASVAGHRLSVETESSKWDPSNYNFYYDPNVPEVQKIQSLFSGMKVRISELLNEWPDHPALQQICQIMKRIESFRMDSPLMKFLTGLELLLGTTQEWESIASQKVSIASHLAELTHLIISWRKLELRFWKNLLEQTFRKHQAEAKTWWFHLFSATMELIYDSNNTNNDSKVEETLLQLLHRFMESSSIGAFGTRLVLLKNLHRHLILLKNHKLITLRPCIQPFLWNTIRYYSMFEELVTSKLASLKTPIEKKLKEFMKISRWNDSNFYALLDSVKKSQRTLNKLIVEYKKVLQTPVSTVLVADVGMVDEEGTKSKYKLAKMDSNSYILPEDLLASFNPKEDQVAYFSSNLKRQKRFKKLPQLYLKARNIFKSVVGDDRSLCQNEVSELAELTGTVIEKVHSLQNLPIPANGPQRKKALHNIHNLRRKNLADLFKVLQGFGLSYKRGVVRIQNFPEAKVPYDFLTEPMDLSAGWSHFYLNQLPKKMSSPDNQMIEAWDSCEDYFQKCIARIAIMMKSFQTPSKELGTMISERCKGFTVELFTIVCDQKTEVSKFSGLLWNLKALIELDSLSNSSTKLEEWKLKIYPKICSLEYEISQYKMVFESLSSRSFASDQKTQILSEIQFVLTNLERLKQKMSKSMSNLTIPLSLHSPLTPGMVESCCQLMSGICTSLSNIIEYLPQDSILKDKIFGVNKLAGDCCEDVKKLSEIVCNIEPEGEQCDVNGRFRTAANKVLESILLAFQNLKKNNDTNAQDSNSAIEEIRRNIASEKLKHFCLETVYTEYAKMRSIVCKKLSKGENCSEMINIINSLKLMAQQYILTSQFYLKSTLRFHRECSKLLYVLLGLFGTLAQKGFCLPSDYEEEAMEEGAELDAKSGMGLGEGEMTSDAKDVSDRLESEDQLDDTLKAGESAEPADKDLNDDEKGVEMSEDFEGKQQDKQQTKEKDDNESEDSGDEAEELDKQMGDIDGENEDVLDEKMWGGSSDEEEDDENPESNEGKGVAQGQEPELAPKDPKVKPTEEPEKKSQEPQPTKDYNDMDEGEINDDQTDPYHGQDKPEEDIEPMDLPDNLQLDGDEDGAKNEEQEPNPFDLDSKEMEDFQDVDTEEKQENREEGEKEISDKGEDDENDMDTQGPQLEVEDEVNDENEGPNKQPDPAIPEQITDVMDTEENPEEDVPPSEDAVEQDTPQKSEEPSESSKDPKKEPDSNTSIKDKEMSTSEPQDDNATLMKPVDEENKDSNDDKASGQVNSEDGRGQEGQTLNKENADSLKDSKEENASRKPGETDSDRSLASELTKSRLKTVQEQDKDTPEDQGCENDDMSQKEADLYQHIKQAEKHDALTIDNATSEQQQGQQRNKNEESEELPKMEEDEPEDDQGESDIEELDDVKLDINQPDLIKGLPQEKKRKRKQNIDEEPEEKVEVPGVKVPTYGAQRPSESVFQTQMNLLEDKSVASSSQNNPDSYLIPKLQDMQIGDMRFMSEWNELERKTIPLAQELCEQLRLILEPTQASKLKGDYKTGKRLNMRKVIPYIASGFRKDKIWMRRTQPSKREYQILLALDDSASMADNQSKQMAFSAVAVVAKALSLLEVGQLAVASFGEDVQLFHPFEEPFTDFSGARLMQKFTFAQRKTRIIQLMETSTALFNHAKQSFGNSTAPVETAQLLLIVSDGRAVCHEGSEIVKNAVRKAMEQNIFIVFVIVDNPENQYSILDIQRPIFNSKDSKQGSSVQFVKYMDEFPFPFYLILRDLCALPSVLSDALRQWFELVTSSSR